MNPICLSIMVPSNIMLKAWLRSHGWFLLLMPVALPLVVIAFAMDFHLQDRANLIVSSIGIATVAWYLIWIVYGCIRTVFSGNTRNQYSIILSDDSISTIYNNT